MSDRGVAIDESNLNFTFLAPSKAPVDSFQAYQGAINQLLLTTSGSGAHRSRYGPAYLVRRRMQGIIGEVCIPLSCNSLLVPEQSADYRQSKAISRPDGGKRMAEVMETDIVQLGL